jgi:hypothetical protein
MNLRGQILPTIMMLLGVALIVRGAILGALIAIILGVLFIGAGAGRIWLERRL